MKTPLGTELDLGGFPALRESGTAPPPLLGPCLLWPRSPISATAEVLFSNAYEASVLSLQRGGEEQQDGDETLSSAESLLHCITRHLRRDTVVSFSSLPRDLPRRIIYHTCRCVQCTPAVINSIKAK